MWPFKRKKYDAAVLFAIEALAVGNLERRFDGILELKHNGVNVWAQRVHFRLDGVQIPSTATGYNELKWHYDNRLRQEIERQWSESLAQANDIARAALKGT